MAVPFEWIRRRVVPWNDAGLAATSVPAVAPSGTLATRRSGAGRLRRAHAAMDQRDPEQIPGDPQRQARPRPHSRAAAVRPADRDDRHPVAAPPGEVDQLDVEDDA